LLAVVVVHSPDDQAGQSGRTIRPADRPWRSALTIRGRRTPTDGMLPPPCSSGSSSARLP